MYLNEKIEKITTKRHQKATFLCTKFDFSTPCMNFQFCEIFSIVSKLILHTYIRVC